MNNPVSYLNWAHKQRLYSERETARLKGDAIQDQPPCVHHGKGQAIGCAPGQQSRVSLYQPMPEFSTEVVSMVS